MFKAIKKWAVGLAVSYAKDYATVGKLMEWVTDGVNALLKKAMSGADMENVAKVCETCNNVSVLCATVAKAISDGTLTEQESKVIIADVYRVMKTSPLTDEKLAALVDKVGDIIKERV